MSKTVALLAAIFALSAAPVLAASSSAPAAGPYKLDAAGKCRGARGYVAMSLCATPTTAPTTKKAAKACKVGKPCGNTCIANNKQCHIP